MHKKSLAHHHKIIRSLDTLEIFEKLQDSVVIVDPSDNKLIYFNDATCKSLGYDRDELWQIDSSFFMARNDIDTIQSTHKKILNGETVEFISQHVKKDGTVQYADLKLFPIQKDNVTLICGIWSDITSDVDFKKSQEIKNVKLFRFLETLQSISESSDFYLGHIESLTQSITKLVSDILEIDRVSIRLFNKDKTELSSSALYDKQNQDRVQAKSLYRADYPDFFSFLENTTIVNIPDIQKNRSASKLIKVFFSQDGMINALLSTRIVVEGNITGFIFFQSRKSRVWDRDAILFASHVSNLIAIALLNHRLRAQSDWLEKEVQIRTEDLLKSKVEAEKANQAKSKFLSSVSHEIRTPLNAIIGFSSLIDLSVNNNKNMLYFSKIKDGTEDLLSIINDVLDYSKIESGKMEVTNDWVDLLSFFEKISSFYKTNIEASGLEFNSQISLINRLFYTDEKLVKQVIHNLLSNAKKFTLTGQIQLEINEQIIDDANSLITMKVIDTGIGIDTHNLDRIFESFEQVKENEGLFPKGTGLGLSIAKESIALLNGSVSVESVIDRGTIFTVAFHALYQKSLSSQGTYIPLKIDDEPLPKLNLLLVEDNSTNREFIISALEYKDIAIDIATDGFQALKKIEEKTYDIVLMDIQLPILDGKSTTEIIRLNKEFNSMIIIALTADPFDISKSSYLEKGFDSLLIKPVTQQDLISSIRHSLNKPQTFDSMRYKKENKKLLMKKYLSMDVDLALRYVGNSQQIYDKLLLNFIEKHENDFSDIRSQNEENLISYALNKLHQLKGLTKMFGIPKLHEQVVSAESKMKHDISHTQALNLIEHLGIQFEFYLYMIKYIHRLDEKEERHGLQNFAS